MTLDRAMETAADYADSLMVARRAKNALILILILLVLAQLIFFFLVRFDVIDLWAVPPDATTQPAAFDWRLMLHYVIGLTAFLGVTLTIVLGFILLLIVNVMLVGRLIGVARLTSAYIWALILLVLLFPWQAFLNHVGLTPDVATFKIPGVLYTWYELIDPQLGAKFSNQPVAVAILKWARFVVFPIVAILILLSVQIKSARGLKQALGEADVMPPDRTVPEP